MQIHIDYRERKSGLVELLEQAGFEPEIEKLPVGDYLLANRKIIIERKTGRDFLVSIIDGRLFSQISSLKKSCQAVPLLLIEGNPFKTDMEMSYQAIRGAILSIQATWQVPVIYSKNLEDSCQIMKMIHSQAQEQQEEIVLRHGYRPKRLHSRQLYILQGLPGVGPVMARRLLAKFGIVKNVFTASESELVAVEGIGLEIASRIVTTLNRESASKTTQT